MAPAPACPAPLLAGIGLAASRLYVRSKTKQAETDNPPHGKFVDVDGVRLHYRNGAAARRWCSCTATACMRATSNTAGWSAS
ncbi:hypothetical protein [Massilia sp. Dwa41.01b]|uniref:hypothetical protein n=1 Tax=Massilia sp. Dwa41.01b TaxID=2709302 RepID=UPI001E60FD41|nr:hypothetical protein [Massilia sp. Dwa41.01b]